jgi:hypothetical protein
MRSEVVLQRGVIPSPAHPPLTGSFSLFSQGVPAQNSSSHQSLRSRVTLLPPSPNSFLFVIPQPEWRPPVEDPILSVGLSALCATTDPSAIEPIDVSESGPTLDTSKQTIPSNSLPHVQKFVDDNVLLRTPNPAWRPPPSFVHRRGDDVSKVPARD